MKLQSRALLILAVVLGLCFLGAAQEQGDLFHWSGKLAPNQFVQIKNINGAIDAEGSSGDTVDISAVKSGPDRDQVHVQMVQTGDGVTVCAVYPGASCTGDRQHAFAFAWQHQGARGLHREAAAQPALQRLFRQRQRPCHEPGTSGQGEHGERRCRSQQLLVGFSYLGERQRESLHGQRRLGRQAQRFHRERLGHAQHARRSQRRSPLRSVNGNLSTDFPLTVQGNSGFNHGPKKLQGTIGNGSRELDVSTVNGSLTIIKGRAAM